MVIRVNQDGTLMPFEIMPELFLGRSIRQLLTIAVRQRFEEVCLEVAETRVAQVFVPQGFAVTDEVMVTPILDDDDGAECRFLVCWARQAGDDAGPPPGETQLSWQDLDLDHVEIRYRAISSNHIEAAPWWAVGDDGIDLWTHQHRVSSLGLSAQVMGELVSEAFSALADHQGVAVRIDMPGAEMLSGIIPLCHGVLKACGVAPERVVVGVPVEIAVDPDLLPLIVHLRTLGLQIDIVGLDALTAKLHTVSDTSDHRHALPAVSRLNAGRWTPSASEAVRDAARL